MTKEERTDGWINSVKGIGTSLGRKPGEAYEGAERLDLRDLGELYDGDWLARRIIDLVPTHALQVDPVVAATEVIENFNEINYTDRFSDGALQRGLKWGRLYGGAAIILGVQGSGSALSAPVGPGGKLAWLDVVPRHELKAVEFDKDANSATFGMYQLVEIIGEHPRRGNRVHASRTIYCPGAPSAKSRLSTDGVQGFPPGISVLQPVWEVLLRYGISWAAFSDLIQQASIGKLKMKGLIDMITSKQQDAINNRIDLFNMSVSVAKTIMLDSDGDEEYSREDISFADLPAVMQQICYSVSGAAGIPATKLFGISPSGLNATGDSDTRNYYDDIASYQSRSVRPKLAKILNFFGQVKGKDIKFPPLWVPTAKETEETRVAAATADRTWFDMGAFTAAELKRARMKNESFGVPIVVETWPEPEAIPEPDPTTPSRLEPVGYAATTE